MSELDEKAGKYLAFTLGTELYGLPVLKVREIIRLVPITPVPQMPEHVRGVINLRGKIVPVLDLRIRFGMPIPENSESACVVVVQVKLESGIIQMGLIVDGVEEVINIRSADMEPTPEFGTSEVHTDYLIGMAKIKQRVVALLDIDQVVRSSVPDAGAGGIL